MKRTAMLVVACLTTTACHGHHQGPGVITQKRRAGRRRGGARRSPDGCHPPPRPGGDRANEADPLRRPARPHHLLRRRLHAQPADAAGRGRASAGRRLRLRALLLASSTSGASTTTPKRSRRSTGRRPRRPSGSATPSPAIRRIPTSSPSSAGSGRRSARRRTTTTATRTSSSATSTRTRCRRGRSAPSTSSSSARCARRRRCGSACSCRSSTGRTGSATSTSARTSSELRDTPMCPHGRRHAPAARRLPRVGADAAGAVREAVAVGLRHHRHPARHDLGLLHAARHRPGTSSSPRAQHDPEKQTLIEVYSGHGNSEEYRDWHAVAVRRRRARRSARRRRDDYLPCCWQAGEIIRARCGDMPGRRVRAARRRRRAATTSTPASPATSPCPARRSTTGRTAASAATASIRRSTTGPANSVQYIARAHQLRRPGASAPLPLRLHRLERQPHGAAGHRLQGVRAPHDDRGGRPARRDVGQPPVGPPPDDRARSRCRFDRDHRHAAGLPARRHRAPGLVLHDRRPGRGARRRAATATRSGTRSSGARSTAPAATASCCGSICSTGRTAPLPMGSRDHARARRRASACAPSASFKQLPGCPEHVDRARSRRSGSQRLCRGECYNPSDERHLITRIEVVRIRPQAQARRAGRAR